ncbi:MAG TPA: hypothetical protein VK629_19310, partial [Steroidobacteraceae bacterium]|nr:hypothetical protein [Steroidobacteraceae bacterium]
MNAASPTGQSDHHESRAANIDRHALRLATREADSRTLNGIRVALTVLASIAALWALQWGSVFLVPCVVAICMTFWLMPLVDRLARMQVPRSLGAALVLFGLMGG